MSLSFSKWKNIFSGVRGNDSETESQTARRLKLEAGAIKLEPEVGFKMILDANGSSPKSSSLNTTDKQQNLTNVPELNVHIIGARHLPTSFGIKSVEGYIIKVKLFPGSTRYDTTIQTNSWPKFNETFKFPLAPTLKSSIRSRSKEDCLARTPPEKHFKGHFVVLTVFALLELPPSTQNPIKEKYQSFKRKGSILLKEKNIIKGKSDKNGDVPVVDDKEEDKSVFNLTKSESRRNIGSVTCYLNPKIFLENPRTGHYCTEELWQPVKDITVSATGNSNIKTNQLTSSSAKGQVEVTLQICEEDVDVLARRKGSNPFDDAGDGIAADVKSSRTRASGVVDIVALNSSDVQNGNESDVGTVMNGGNTRQGTAASVPSPSKSRWSLGDVKKKITGREKNQQKSGTCLKFNITRMRCSIKVKEEFESIAGEEIYLKATIFERGILSSTWKSKVFAPSLSMRWDVNESQITIPLVNDHDIEYISIKVSVATKTKMAKKVFLGTLHLGHDTVGERYEHWDKMISSRGTAVTKWHNFE